MKKIALRGQLGLNRAFVDGYQEERKGVKSY